MRAYITDFLGQRFEQVVSDFEQINPKDRIKVYTDLLQYGLPELQTISNVVDLENKEMNSLTNYCSSLEIQTYDATER